MNSNMRIVGWRIPDDKGGYDYFFKEPSDFDKAYQKKLYQRDFEPVYVIENLPCYIDRFKNGIKILKVGDVENGITMTQELVDSIIKQVNDKSPLFGEFNPSFSIYINLEKCSHTVLNMYLENDTLCADFKILNTQHGDLLWDYFDKVTPVLRCCGTEPDLKLITVDFEYE